MKTTIFLHFLLFSTITFSQNNQDSKRDYIWLFGYDSNTQDSTFGGTVLDFNYDPVKISYQYRNMNFRATNSSISDEEGNLLFYSNGAYIAQGNHAPLLNGNGINPGPWTEGFAFYGLPIPQSALMLPFPDEDNYILFHTQLDALPVIAAYISKIYYSKIDIDFFSGTPGVLPNEKNIEIISDTLDYGKLTATRHGNGRDWWLIHGENGTNCYYTFMLTPEGIKNIEKQCTGLFIPSGLGQSVFSPDGTKFTRYDGINVDEGNFLNLYDFDRCSGLLSNPKQIHIVDSALCNGLAISQNSRFLYVNSFTKVYQYDLWEEDIEASMEVVAVYDGFTSPSSTTFYLSQLAPDGKIYINSNTGINVLHVIHNPDEKGAACNFEQHGIELPTINNSSMPNFPNFRLGRWEDSPCDTLDFTSSDEELIENAEYLVFPNPADDMLNVSVKNTGATEIIFSLRNQLGHLVKQIYVSNEGKEAIELNDIPAGIYFYEFLNGKQLLKQGKLSIFH